MKLLLFDQNISPRAIDHLADVYPGSVHVFMLGRVMRWILKFGNMHMIMIT